MSGYSLLSQCSMALFYFVTVIFPAALLGLVIALVVLVACICCKVMHIEAACRVTESARGDVGDAGARVRSQSPGQSRNESASPEDIHLKVTTA